MRCKDSTNVLNDANFLTFFLAKGVIFALNGAFRDEKMVYFLSLESVTSTRMSSMRAAVLRSTVNR